MSSPTAPIVTEDTPFVLPSTTTLYWREPLSSGDSPISSYTLTCSSIFFQTNVAYPTNFYSLSNLDDGVDYNFTLYATNQNGNASEEAYYYPLQTGNPPGPTQSNVNSILTSNAAYFEWAPPVSDGNSAIDYYSMIFYPIDAQSNILSNTASTVTYNVNGNELSTLISFENTTAQYKYIVRSINSAGWSPDTTDLYTVFRFQNPPWLPSQLTSLRLWYDGVDPFNTGIQPTENQQIVSIADKSGYGFTGAAANTVARYSTGTSSIQMFADSYYLTNNYSAGSSNETLFIVYKTDNYSRHFLIGTNSNGGREFYINSGRPSLQANSAFQAEVVFSQTGSALLNQTTIGAIVISNQNWSLYVNGASNLTPAFYSVNPARVTRIGNSFWTSNSVPMIHEVVGFNTVLSLNDRQRVEGYLAWKWGSVQYLASDHPYKNSRPTM